jgi:hypothetical protein
MYKYLVSIEDTASPFKEKQTRYERVCIWLLWYLFGSRRSNEIALRMAERMKHHRMCDHETKKD